MRATSSTATASPAGVTSGIDFGLRIVTLLRGADNARVSQLLAEYDPAPPFDSGSPHKAWPESVAVVENMIANFSADLVRAGQSLVGKALGRLAARPRQGQR